MRRAGWGMCREGHRTAFRARGKRQEEGSLTTESEFHPVRMKPGLSRLRGPESPRLCDIARVMERAIAQDGRSLAIESWAGGRMR
jgi:hypothetical protein